MLTDKINILYIHNKTKISGGERSLLNLWKELNRDRFRCYLIVPDNGLFCEAARKTGVEVLFLRISKLSLPNLFKIIKTCFLLVQFVRKHHINIIHSYTPRNNILSSLVGRMLGVPVIWHERNLIFGKEKDITKRFLFLPDKIICNSHAVAERFQKKGRLPPKIKVILNGVNLNLFNPGINPQEIKKKFDFGNKKAVGIVTNFSKRKRLEYFLQAAVIISKKIKDVLFLVVGGDFSDEGSSRLDELREEANALVLKNHIIFTGFQNDVAMYLATFDLFVHVALKEACSRAIIESMAMGKAVVAMNDGGNPELIKNKETGMLIAPEDINAFVEAIVNLLSDDAKRIEMGKKARRRAEEFFDVKRNAGEIECIYSDLLKGRVK